MNLLLATAVLLQVQFRDDPKDWRLLKSANFDIYYPADGLEPRAKEFAGMFEEARHQIAKTCGALLERRINVFLYRGYHDLAQASFLGHFKAEHPGLALRGPLLGRPAAGARARCCEFVRSRAFALAEPLRDRIFIHCQASDRWNAWFVRHELVHQLQYQQIYPWRLPSFLIAFKDPIIPQWFWEGFADYGAGIFDSHKDEWVRDLSRERLFTLKELFSGNVLDRHDYLAVYYQASLFFRYLDDELGPGSAAKVFRAYADASVPLTMNRVLWGATGRTRAELEEGFEAWIRKRYAPMSEGRVAPTDRRSDTREHYRRRTWGGRWSPDGSRVAWLSDVDVKTELYIDGEGQFDLHRGFDIDGLHSPPSWASDGRRLVVAGWWRHHDYVLVVDPDNGITRIRPDFDEVVDPAWSPAGDVIAFAGLKNGTSDLHLLNLADESVTRVTDDRDGDFAPAWSPDGSKLAFLHEREAKTELVVLDLKTKERRTVGATLALMERPQWTPDGRSIVVAADVDGVYDAFAIDVGTGAATRLTRVPGGVHDPSVSPDGKTLLVTYFEGRGSDLFTLPYAPQPEPGFAQEERRGWYEQFPKPVPQGEPAEKSRSFGVDFLMFPVSSTSFVVPGLDFQVSDLEGENVVRLQGMGASSRAWQATATWLNTRWHPTFGVAAQGGAIGDLRMMGAGPFIAVPYFLSSVGWIARETKEYNDEAPDVDVFDSGPSYGFLFTTQDSTQPRDPSWGVAFSATANLFREDFGGDRDLAEYATALETQLAFTQDTILWTRATYEKKSGGPFLEDELLGIEGSVRGASDLDGTDRGGWTVELRFPLVRDLYWTPLELIGLGEFLVIKDVRGFLFADAGFVGVEIGVDRLEDRGAVSAGAGLRIDLFGMAWPVLNGHGPLRLEFWGGWVGREGEAPDGEGGFGLVLGF